MRTQSADPVEELADRAVLVSGGLDSCVLLAEHAAASRRLWPIFMRCGLAWEAAELLHLERFLRAIKTESLQALTVLEVPASDLLGNHWSVTGKAVPGWSSDDSEVYLPGRNVLLLGKAMIWCHLNKVASVALATLVGNPFPDATHAFISGFEQLVNQAIGGAVRVLQPYARLSKREVMERGQLLPLDLTFSCINPMGDRHCGRCNKCAERRHAFAEARLRDATIYASAD
jgi:7-cyano-7-deazaguanine synthase